jgi:hypothetical protein
VTGSLPVELNRDRLHEIRVVDEFEADGPFAVDLINEGEAVHVHLNVEGDLAAVAGLAGSNHYVEAGATESVSVDLPPVDEPVSGRLTVATGYGAETVAVAVTVVPWADDGGVAVDEELATPATATDPESVATDDGGRSRPSIPLLALVGGAVAVAVAAGVYGPTTPVLVGGGVVIGATLAALVAALR